MYKYNMLDKKSENIYNIIMTIFLAIFTGFFINNIFEKPRIPIIYSKK
jgi:hypothetical protein